MAVLSVIEYFYHIRSVMATLLSQGTGLGEIENHAINEELTRSKRKPQCKYSDEDRYIIAKYAKERGSSKAATFLMSPLLAAS